MRLVKSIIIFSVLLSCSVEAADTPVIIVVPSKSQILPNEEIDIQVYVINDSSSVMRIPTSVLHENYSVCDVDLDAKVFSLDSGSVIALSMPSTSMTISHGGTEELKPSKSKQYVFRWKPTEKEFTVINLSVSLWIDGKMHSGTTSLTPRVTTPVKPK